VLGRSGSNEVVIDEPGVSRKHALITETSAGCAIRDLDSTNGTYVNLYRICQAEHMLRDGDRISLGSAEVTFIFSEGSAESRQPQAAAPASRRTQALRAL
jgi:pSer/pThr/pTyr-binding forkhead associated (FHA) protein